MNYFSYCLFKKTSNICISYFKLALLLFLISYSFGVKAAIAEGTSSRAAEFAIGTESFSDGLYAIAVGYKSKALAEHTVSIGSLSKASAGHGIALGFWANSTNKSGVAIGYSSVAGKESIALGAEAKTDTNSSISIGVRSKAKADVSIALGAAAVAERGFSMALGVGANTKSEHSIVVGSHSVAEGEYSFVVGDNARVKANRAISLGVNSRATHYNSVALGANSETEEFINTSNTIIQGTQLYYYGGRRSSGVVSFGNTYNPLTRQLKNVSAGVISSSSTDAINGSQLYALADVTLQGFNLVTTASVGVVDSQVMNDQVKPTNTLTIDAGNNIKLTHNANHISISTNDKGNFRNIAIGDVSIDKDTGINAGNKVVTNVANGSILQNSLDAINGSQLFALQERFSHLAKDVEINKANIKSISTNSSNRASPDGKIKLDIATNKVNIEQNTAGISTNKVNVEQNTADISTNKVNIEQNTADISTNKVNIEQNAVDISTNKVNIEQNAVDISTNKVNIEQNTADILTNKANITRNTNDITSTKALVEQGINIVGDETSAATNKKLGSKIVIAGGAVTNRSQLSDNNIAVIPDDNGGLEVKLAKNLNLGQEGSINVGKLAITNGNISTSIETNQDSDGINTLSIGNINSPTRVINVAQGTRDTDAVNMGQLRSNISQVTNRVDHAEKVVNKNRKRASAGTASGIATASIPQVYKDGYSNVGVGTGYFHGQSAIAVGYSRASANGKFLMKLNANTNTQNESGFGAGVSYQWK